MKKLLSLLAVVALLAFGGCAIPPTAPPPTDTPTAPAATPITVAMGYIPNVQFAPFYVAVEKGYFADENLEVNFDYGWETDLLKLVGTGELQFAVASGDQVILARSQGLPVVYVMNWYRKFPICLVSLKEKGLQKPQDLVGKTVGVPALYGASYIGWRALLHSEGIDEAEVNLQNIGYTQVASLTEGQVDAAVCYIMNEPVQLKQSGQEVNIIAISDYVNLVSNGLITNEQTIAEEPALVQNLVRAVLRGLRYTIDHPDEAFEICLKHVPEAGGENAPQQMAVLQESIKLWRADDLGRSDPAAWEASQRFMIESGFVDTETDIQQMFTNQFIVEP
ncbi:MAG TPA: ABC transporter substrate-binding protein [Anaerolineae bacterium]|nr:ABC transporter substrate-binding protein [Anaerolineae bacterium]